MQGVQAIGVMTELVQLLALYGAIEEYRVLDEYPAEEFTEVYLFKFQKLTSARWVVPVKLVKSYCTTLSILLMSCNHINCVILSGQLNETRTRRAFMEGCYTCVTLLSMRLWRTPGRNYRTEGDT